MMQIILYLYEKTKNLISASIPISKITDTGIFSDLLKIKYEIPNDNLDLFKEYFSKIDKEIDTLI
jgi:V/A-type H+-transporting ATPase subunit A